jgi:hypothetical protein
MNRQKATLALALLCAALPIASTTFAQPIDPARVERRRAVEEMDAGREARLRAYEARVDTTLAALLDAARAGDAARFDALLAPADGEEPWLRDGAAGEIFRGPLTADRLRRFATACRRSDYRAPLQSAEPHLHSASFECGPEHGIAALVQYEQDGARVSAVFTVNQQRAVEPNPDHLARVAALPGLVDQLLAAAASGDQARFAVLVAAPSNGLSPSLFDERATARGEGVRTALTAATLWPLIANCRPGSYQPAAMNIDPPIQLRALDCPGQPPVLLSLGFDREGTRIVIVAVTRHVPPDPVHIAYDAEMRSLQRTMFATVDALLAAARDGAGARFAALLTEPSMGGPATLTDDRESGGVRQLLTVESLRPFAAACRRSSADSEFSFSEPLLETIDYLCGGMPGFQIYAEFTPAADAVGSITLIGPGSSQPISPEEIAAAVARSDAEGAAQEAETRARDLAMVDLVDTLLAAARSGDRAAFAALLSPDASLADWRTRDRTGVPLTIAAALPFAVSCSRMDAPRQEISTDPPSQMALFICDGQPDHHITAEFDSGRTRIISLIVEGRVRISPFD